MSIDVSDRARVGTAVDPDATRTASAQRLARIARWTLPVVLPLLVLVVIVAAWSEYAHSNTGTLFPTPSATLSGFTDSLTSGSAWRETLRSWHSLVIGYAIAVAIGLVLGFVLGASRKVDRILGVYLDIALVTPMIVLMPVVLIALGVTARAEETVVVLFAAPYVILPIRTGVRAMPKMWFDLARSMCANRRQTWQMILLPGARSSVVHGLRLGLAHALTGLFVVEFTLVSIGIGNVVLTYKANFDYGGMIGYVLLVMAQVLIVMSLLTKLDRKGERL